MTASESMTLNSLSANSIQKSVGTKGEILN